MLILFLITKTYIPVKNDKHAKTAETTTSRFKFQKIKVIIKITKIEIIPNNGIFFSFNNCNLYIIKHTK